MIISKTPFRISFFGGGTDYPSWFREHGGKVLATTIDKYCYISCRYLPPFFDHKYRLVYSKIENVVDYRDFEHPAARAALEYLDWSEGLEIHHDGDLPARSGLGSSSSFTVGLLNALYSIRGQYRSADDLAREAIHIEQNLIGEHVGSQDQVSAAYGGLNRIEFFGDGSLAVTPVVVEASRYEDLQRHCMLFFSGISRYANEIAQSKIQNFPKRIAELARMAEMVDEAIALLRSQNGSWEEFGALLHEAWMLKRCLSQRVSTERVDAIYALARSAGALGGKLLGAGGGGFLLFIVPPERQPEVRRRLAGLTYVPVRFVRTGSHIVLYQPNGFE